MDKRTFVIAHRGFTFLDEWGTYFMSFVLLALHFHFNWPLWPFIVAVVWGATCIAISYKRQWEMEKNLNEA